MRLGVQVLISFVITQHVRDVEMILKFKSFFCCGTLIRNKDTVQFRIRSIRDLSSRLFPLLKDYPLQTQKALDAKAFIHVHRLIIGKAHLTESGLQEIRNIKSTINRARI